MSPSPKNGTAGKPVSPTAPGAAGEADVADPGKAAAARAQEAAQSEAEHGATAAEPFSPTEEDLEEKSWIEIELVDEEDNPVPGEPYRITMPDGSVASGTLDENGFAREEGMDPGTCQICFYKLDQDAWEKI